MHRKKDIFSHPLTAYSIILLTNIGHLRITVTVWVSQFRSHINDFMIFTLILPLWELFTEIQVKIPAKIYENIIEAWKHLISYILSQTFILQNENKCMHNAWFSAEKHFSAKEHFSQTDTNLKMKFLRNKSEMCYHKVVQQSTVRNCERFF